WRSHDARDGRDHAAPTVPRVVAGGSTICAPRRSVFCGRLLVTARRMRELLTVHVYAYTIRLSVFCGRLLVTARRMRELLTVHVYAYTIRPMKLMSLPCYCATLRQAARAVTVLYEDMLAGSGLHATQFTALQLLDRARSLTTTELAEALGVDQTTATRTLALIRKAGLASDTVGDDRRERHWALSAQGKALVRKLKPRWEAAQ